MPGAPKPLERHRNPREGTAALRRELTHILHLPPPSPEPIRHPAGSSRTRPHELEEELEASHDSARGRNPAWTLPGPSRHPALLLAQTGAALPTAGKFPGLSTAAGRLQVLGTFLAAAPPAGVALLWGDTKLRVGAGEMGAKQLSTPSTHQAHRHAPAGVALPTILMPWGVPPKLRVEMWK